MRSCATRRCRSTTDVAWRLAEEQQGQQARLVPVSLCGVRCWIESVIVAPRTVGVKCGNLGCRGGKTVKV